MNKKIMGEFGARARDVMLYGEVSYDRRTGKIIPKSAGGVRSDSPHAAAWVEFLNKINADVGDGPAVPPKPTRMKIAVHFAMKEWK